MVDSSLSHSEFAKQLSEYLSISERTIYDWVGDKFKTMENKRDLLIYKLQKDGLGWTQHEIADVIGKHQTAISKVMKKTVTSEICSFFEKGKKIREIARTVVSAGYEKEYTQQSVNKVLQLFAKLQKVVISQFESKKPISDIVKENENNKFRTLANRRDLLIYKLNLLGWSRQEIADAVVRTGYEKSFHQTSVGEILSKFPKLEKHLIIEFENKKPISDIVRENESNKFRTLTNRRDLLIYKLQKDMLGWTQQEIADQIVHADYEKKYGRTAVTEKLSKFPDLEKLTVS